MSHDRHGRAYCTCHCAYCGAAFKDGDKFAVVENLEDETRLSLHEHCLLLARAAGFDINWGAASERLLA